jgi:hypothetical protein
MPVIGEKSRSSFKQATTRNPHNITMVDYSTWAKVSFADMPIRLDISDEDYVVSFPLLFLAN